MVSNNIPLSYRKFKLISLILIKRVKSPVLQTDLIKILGISENDPDFKKIKRILIQEKILNEEVYFRNQLLLKINLNKLESFVRDSEYFKHFGQIVESTVWGYNY